MYLNPEKGDYADSMPEDFCHVLGMLKWRVKYQFDVIQ